MKDYENKLIKTAVGYIEEDAKNANNTSINRWLGVLSAMIKFKTLAANTGKIQTQFGYYS